MHDLVEVLKNIQRIYENTGQLKILTDFERVFDRLDIYLYENWKKGELVLYNNKATNHKRENGGTKRHLWKIALYKR